MHPADGDFKVTESAVVVEYLDKKYGKSGNRLLPEDPEEYAMVRMLNLHLDIFDVQTAVWARVSFFIALTADQPVCCSSCF